MTGTMAAGDTVCHSYINCLYLPFKPYAKQGEGFAFFNGI